MITKTKTLTDLNNFYKFMNADPLSFNGMYLSCLPTTNTLCGDEDIWSQYEMPLSREKLAELVKIAEFEVEDALGTPVSPKWIKEEINIPKAWFNEQTSIPLSKLIFKTKKHNIIRFGQQRLEKIISSVEITYKDLDEDGFNESAEITFQLPEDEQLSDIKLYFYDTNYEITGFIITSYDEDSRQVIVNIDSWLLVKPELYFKRFFNNTGTAIDACNSDNFVEFIDIWVDSVDICKPSIEFVYNEFHQCNGSCQENKQPGCAVVVDKCVGTFKVNLQSYDEETGCVIDKTVSMCSKPNKIIVYYQAGCYDNDALCSQLEDIVFKLVAARYPYPNCDCKCVQSVLQSLAQNTSLYVKDEKILYRYPSSVMVNANFGTAVGEIEASIGINRLLEEFCNYF